MGEIDSNPLLESAMEQRLIRRIAAESASAIFDLWDDRRGCYWRDTVHRRRTDTSTRKLATMKKSKLLREFFPTVTYRSAEALLDLISRYPDWFPKAKSDVILRTHIPKIFSRPLTRVHSAFDIKGSRVRNPFTTALYLITAIRANELTRPGAVIKPGAIEVAARQLMTACVDKKSPYFSERHPFIQFHILRAIIAVLPALAGPTRRNLASLGARIVRNVKIETEQLLARKTLNQFAPSDSVALIFCAAALALEDGPDHRDYLLPALVAGFEAQDTSGCWPLGRVVRRTRGKYGERAWDFTISTYEIAWAASETLLKLLKHQQYIPRSDALPTLKLLLLAGRYAERSSIELPAKLRPKRGWCSDQPYDELLIESWTCANVLQSILSLRELIDEEIRNETLQTFTFRDPRDDDWPSWTRWEALRINDEPDDEKPVYKYLAEKILEPINRSSQRLPSSKEKTVSALLFGPPGTSKTTLVHALADGLNWPVVLLSPGDFIKGGLEYIEAQASAVFERLQKLSRVVVLFDECDELFRNRKPTNESEPMRNITAFVTASMLPKIQDLHDRGRVVFCICTNKFETLDPAIKRGGRIDHRIAIGPPQKGYRQKLVNRLLIDINASQGKKAAVSELTDGTDGFVRQEIERACEMVLARKPKWTDAGAVIHIVTGVIQQIRESLTITENEYREFKVARQKYSQR